MKATTLASLAGVFLASGSAQAAMEVGQLAAGDNRSGILLGLAVPVLGWVGCVSAASLPGCQAPCPADDYQPPNAHSALCIFPQHLGSLPLPLPSAT